jgi:hypothetical protein
MNALSAPLAIGLVLLTIPGCGKKEKAKEKEAQPTPPIATEIAKPVPAAAPVLSMEAVKAAIDLTTSGTPWAHALASLESRLGNVTTIHGTEYRWAVRNTDSCAYLSVEHLAGDTGAKVGAVQGPVVAMASGDAEAWNRCLDSVGAQTTEDATAPMPPAAEGLTTVTGLLDGVDRKPSAWVGARVSIEGFYVSSSIAADGEVEIATVTIAEAKGNLQSVIGCTLVVGAKAPKLSRWDALRVTGTTHGDFGGGLKGCSVAAEE